mgnify:CR=1 FL=1
MGKEISVIGCGRWGMQVIRNLRELQGNSVSAYDTDQSKMNYLGELYPDVIRKSSYQDILESDNTTAVYVATPPASHFETAKLALLHGKHVLVEKPMADRPDHAAALVDEAARRKLTLMVDHTFVYTGAVRKIAEIVEVPAESILIYLVSMNEGIYRAGRESLSEIVYKSENESKNLFVVQLTE